MRSSNKAPEQRLLLTPEQAARSLAISRASLYALLAKRELPSMTIGRSRRIPASALERFVLDRLALED
ncbi:MAG: helix-turn-helix domain-containing protein [Dehalococcoidia bacterium]